jgi:hypothetical protein
MIFYPQNCHQMEYPEIEKLEELTETHAFTFTPGDRLADWIVEVHVSRGTGSWDLLIYDEYHDFDVSKPTLCLYLLLAALDDYRQSKDYPQWCRENMLDPDKHLAYYHNLATVYREIESITGPIDPYISSYCYEMRTGPYAALADS